MSYDLHDHDETRYTDEATGGQKGGKLTQLGALDPLALIALSRVAGYGANKYAAFNFLKGYDWALSFNAMQRHALLFWAGEDIDEESGQPHMAMAAWHALTLTSFMLRDLGTDTRFVQEDEETFESKIKDAFKHTYPELNIATMPPSGRAIETYGAKIDHRAHWMDGRCFICNGLERPPRCARSYDPDTGTFTPHSPTCVWALRHP